MRCASYCTGLTYDIGAVFNAYKTVSVNAQLFDELVIISIEQ